MPYVRRRPACAVALALLLAVSWGCAKKRPMRVPVTPSIGSVEYGVASWYGHPYHGRRTASGEVYDMEKLTAAHRTLPFDSWVEVENLSNGRKVEVRINDRGPFVEGRVIDLSRAAARQLHMLGPGIVKVRLEVVAPPSRVTEAARFAVQVGAFAERGNAERLVESLREQYPTSRVVRREGPAPPWRVLVGAEESLDAAQALARDLRTAVREAFVVRLDEAPSGGL